MTYFFLICDLMPSWEQSSLNVTPDIHLLYLKTDDVVLEGLAAVTVGYSQFHLWIQKGKLFWCFFSFGRAGLYGEKTALHTLAQRNYLMKTLSFQWQKRTNGNSRVYHEKCTLVVMQVYMGNAECKKSEITVSATRDLFTLYSALKKFHNVHFTLLQIIQCKATL